MLTKLGLCLIHHCSSYVINHWMWGFGMAADWVYEYASEVAILHFICIYFLYHFLLPSLEWEPGSGFLVFFCHLTSYVTLVVSRLLESQGIPSSMPRPTMPACPQDGNPMTRASHLPSLLLGFSSILWSSLKWCSLCNFVQFLSMISDFGPAVLKTSEGITISHKESITTTGSHYNWNAFFLF